MYVGMSPLARRMFLERLDSGPAIEGKGGHTAMKSKATTVEEYLADVPEERRRVLETLRTLCLEELAGCEEGMQYGMPSYSRDGSAVEVAFASQKNYISLYVWESVINANAHLLDGL